MALLLALVLVAFGLRLATIGLHSLWLDEGDSLGFAQRDLVSLLRTFLRVGENGPLYFLLLHFWIPLAGTSELSLRFPSALAGTLTVPVAVAFGQRLGGRSLGFCLGIVVAVAYYLVWYSREVRMYSMVVLLSLLASYLLHRGLTRSRPRTWAAYVLVTTLSLYLHLFAVFLIAFHVSFLAVYWLSTRRIPRASLVSVGALTLPYLPLAVWQLPALARPPDTSYQYGFLPLPTIAMNLLTVFSVAYDRPVQVALAVLAGIGGLTLAGAHRVVAERNWWPRWPGHGRRQPRRSPATAADVASWPPLLTAGFVVLHLVAPVATYYVVSLVAPFFYVRYLSLILPGYYCLLAAGVVGLGRIFRPIGWLAMAGLLVLWLPPAFSMGVQKENWRAAAEYTRALARPSDTFVFVPPNADTLFRYYLDPAIPTISLPLRSVTEYAVGEVPAALAASTAARRGVWLVESHLSYWPTAAPIREWLSAHGRQLSEQRWQAENPVNWMGDVSVSYFLLPRAEERVGRAEAPPAATFDDRLDLLRWSSEAATVRAGEHLALSFRWRAHTRLKDEYRLSLRLTDDRDRVWGQMDAEPGGQANPTPLWTPGEPVDAIVNLPVDPGTPAGTYMLRLVAYRTGSEPVEVALPDQPGRRHSLDLMRLTVTRPGIVPGAGWRPDGQPFDLDFGGRARLLSVYLPSNVEAGRRLKVISYWRILKPLDRSPQLRLRLDRGATAIADGVWPLAEGAGPWRPGEIVRSDEDLMIPSSVEPGDATLQLAVGDDAGLWSRRWAGLPLPWLRPEVPVGDLAVGTRPREFSPPDMERSSGARFGRGVTLLGYRLEPAAPARGDELRVTLFWQASAALDRDYVVFVHVGLAGQPPLAQRDEAPAAGRAPTGSWLPGEVVRDEKRLQLPPSLPAGSYQVLVGLYDPSTERRLPVEAGGDFVVLSTLAFPE